MDITLYSFSKRANSTKRPSGGVTVSGYLREGADLRSPSFILKIPPDQLSTYMSYNYAQVLGQYYYIGEPRNRSASEWEIPLTMDELATFRSDIMNTTAFVAYSSQNADLTLYDNRLPVPVTYHNRKTSSVSPFYANGFGKPCYVLSVVGHNTDYTTLGTTATYVLSDSDLNDVATDFVDGSVRQTLSQFFSGDPEKAIISLRKFPFNLLEVIGNENAVRTKIWYGDCESARASGYLVNTKALEYNSVHAMPRQMSIAIPRQSGAVNTFYAVEPYVSYRLYVPYCGIYSIPATELVGATSLLLKYRADIITGTLTVALHVITQQDDYVAEPLMMISGACGAEIPVGKTQAGGVNNLGSIISSATMTVIGMATENPALTMQGATGAASAVSTSFAAISQSAGAFNSLNGSGYGEYPTLIGYFHLEHQDILDWIANTQERDGMLLMKWRKLGDLSGYCRTINAHVTAAASSEHLRTIEIALNSGIYLE